MFLRTNLIFKKNLNQNSVLDLMYIPTELRIFNHGLMIHLRCIINLAQYKYK